MTAKKDEIPAYVKKKFPSQTCISHIIQDKEPIFAKEIFSLRGKNRCDKLNLTTLSTVVAEIVSIRSIVAPAR